MEPQCRPYQTEDDFWRMREFLREVFLLNDRRERSWHVARLDYARWHVCLNCAHVRIDDVAYLWEADGELVAFLMPDGGRGEAQISIHPAFRSAELEEEMIALSEERLTAEGTDGSQHLLVWAHADDPLRQEILLRRGYQREGWREFQWRLRLDVPVSEVPVPQGYTVRPMGDGLELLERCYASGLGFHDGDLKVATENRTDVSWYRNIQNAPLYRRDLDLVVIAPDGAVAALSTFWFDDVTRSVYIEPVATVPAQQRRGLARAMLSDGLRRVQRMGALTAAVGGSSVAANALYGSLLGPDHEVYEAWIKQGF